MVVQLRAKRNVVDSISLWCDVARHFYLIWLFVVQATVVQPGTSHSKTLSQQMMSNIIS